MNAYQFFKTVQLLNTIIVSWLFDNHECLIKKMLNDFDILYYILFFYIKKFKLKTNNLLIN